MIELRYVGAAMESNIGLRALNTGNKRFSGVLMKGL